MKRGERKCGADAKAPSIGARGDREYQRTGGLLGGKKGTGRRLHGTGVGRKKIKKEN